MTTNTDPVRALIQKWRRYADGNAYDAAIRQATEGEGNE